MKKQETNPDPLFATCYKVRFYDTDLSTTAFFSNYPKWLDSIAVIDYLAHKGIDWQELLKRNIDVAIAHISFDFLAPLFLNDDVEMAVEKVQLGNKSIRISGSFYRGYARELVAQGELVYVFVDGSTRKTIPIPEDFREKLP